VYKVAHDGELVMGVRKVSFHVLDDSGIVNCDEVEIVTACSCAVAPDRNESVPRLLDGREVRGADNAEFKVIVKDFTQNLAWRESIYEETGALDCFVAVGGNLTSLGRGEEGATLGQGVMKARSKVLLDEDSGLVQRYMAQGTPVVNLLNIKQIMAEYGMPFDPQVWPETGTSAAYSTIRYQKEILFAGLCISGGLLAVCLWLRRRPAISNL
jgi:hypothetical protein